MLTRIQTVPNAITALRILILPPLAMSLERNRISLSITLLTFAIFSDFLDGWLARRFRQETNVGKLMDPVADKILVCVLVVFLLARPEAQGPALNKYLAILLLGREFFISALRAMAGSVGLILPASRVGKYKAAFQFVGLGFFVLGTRSIAGMQYSWLGEILLWSSVLLSYWSMSVYSYRVFLEIRTQNKGVV
jgi:CDP-diacylglycerol--glycerol-3-phosphate 3-phosphatidyltransferase